MRTRSIGSRLPRTATRVALGLALLAVPATAVATTAGPAGQHAPAAHRTAPHTARAATGLDDPAKKDIAMQLVSSAENSSLDWRAQYRVHRGHRRRPRLHRRHHRLLLRHRRHAGARRALHRSASPATCWPSTSPPCARWTARDSHDGLDRLPRGLGEGRRGHCVPAGPGRRARPGLLQPRGQQGKADGLRALGQFVYYDAIVMHGGGDDGTSFGGIRKRALDKAKPPAQGGDETDLPERVPRRPGRGDEARGGAQRHQPGRHRAAGVPQQRQPRPAPPLAWKVYGDSFKIS